MPGNHQLKSASSGRYAVPDEAVELLVVTAGGGGTMFFRASEVELKPPDTRDPQVVTTVGDPQLTIPGVTAVPNVHVSKASNPHPTAPTVLLSCDRPEPERIRPLLGMEALGRAQPLP